MFAINRKDLGTIKVGSRNTVEFEAPDNITDVHIVQPDCTCVDVHFNQERNLVSFSFKPKKIPKHLELKGQTYYLSTKSITVQYKEDGVKKTEFLTIKARVEK